jgi:hypothetical protein
MEESRIVVEYKGEKYGVVLPVNGLFVDKVKKMVITELKATKSVFRHVQLYDDWLTLMKLDGTIIEEERMPQGDKFLATLTREEDPGKFMFYYG